MSANNMKPIDVYSDKFDKVRVIDFEKLKQESLRLYKISKKQIFKHLINWTLLISFFGFLIFLLYEAAILFLFVFSGGAVILSIFFFFEKKLYKKRFPEGTPDDLFLWHFKPETIEKKLYAKYILHISDTLLDNFEYRMLGIIKSNKSDDDLKQQAYKLKANILTNYQAQINYTSKVKSDYSGRFVDTDTKKHERHEAIAVEILNENKEDKNKRMETNIDIHNEIMKLVKLKDENIISEEEFELAKKKLLN